MPCDADEHTIGDLGSFRNVAQRPPSCEDRFSHSLTRQARWCNSLAELGLQFQLRPPFRPDGRLESDMLWCKHAQSRASHARAILLLRGGIVPALRSISVVHSWHPMHRTLTKVKAKLVLNFREYRVNAVQSATGEGRIYILQPS